MSAEPDTNVIHVGSETTVTIAGIKLPGIYEVEESGGGIKSQYELETQSSSGSNADTGSPQPQTPGAPQGGQTVAGQGGQAQTFGGQGGPNAQALSAAAQSSRQVAEGGSGAVVAMSASDNPFTPNESRQQTPTLTSQYDLDQVRSAAVPDPSGPMVPPVATGSSGQATPAQQGADGTAPDQETQGAAAGNNGSGAQGSGQGDGAESPPRVVTLRGWCGQRVWDELSALIGTRGLYTIEAGPLTLTEMELEDLRYTQAGDTSRQYQIEISSREYREVVLESTQEKAEVVGGSGTAAGGGAAANYGPVGDWINEPGSPLPTPDTDKTINLNEQGLSEGEVIDPYLNQYFKTGNRVTVNAGTYKWGGGGIPNEIQRAALVAVGGQVVLNGGNNNAHKVRFSVRGGGPGSVRFDSITFRGTKKDSSWFKPIVRDSGSGVVLNNLRFPDGGIDGDSSNAMFVNKSHAGTIFVRNWFFQGFSDNGIYATAPGRTDRSDIGGGRIVVDGGIGRNNNITNVRPGGNGSIVRKFTSVHDSDAPVSRKHPCDRRGSCIQRGIWCRDKATNTVIADNDFFQSTPGQPISVGGGSGGGGRQSSGEINNNRMTNHVDKPAITVKEGNWSGRGNHFTGSGNLETRGGNFSGSVRGSNAQPASRNPTMVGGGNQQAQAATVAAMAYGTESGTDQRTGTA